MDLRKLGDDPDRHRRRPRGGLGGVTYPEFPRQISQASLTDLNLLFAGLVVLGPFAFQALRRAGASEGEVERGLWGKKWALLIACAITLWATLGELAALALLCWELTAGGVVGVLLLMTLAGAAYLGARYFWVTVATLLAHDWERACKDGRREGGSDAGPRGDDLDPPPLAAALTSFVTSPTRCAVALLIADLGTAAGVSGKATVRCQIAGW